MPRSTSAKRGRPLKFGRPSEIITLTLPKDAVSWLETIDEDLGWAVVKLHQRNVKASARRPTDVATLVQLPEGRSLILVRPDYFDKLKGVSLIRLADGRAFLALDAAKGVADLELAVVDRLGAATLRVAERDALTRLRALLQQWRREGILFESRSIIIARRRQRAGRPKPLSSLDHRGEV